MSKFGAVVHLFQKRRSGLGRSKSPLAPRVSVVIEEGPTRRLFAYAELESEMQWAAIASTPVCRKWWQQMAKLMPHNSDGSPQVTDLKEVFHFP
jgi:L-rhamnose mutarotase